MTMTSPNRRRRRPNPWRGIALLAWVAACGGTEHLEDAECTPAGEELTYENFGQPFLGAYCQECHARDQLDRRGAPDHVSFDSHGDVWEWDDRIYARSAASNKSMPPGPDDPPLEERALLAQWLACGAP